MSRRALVVNDVGVVREMLGAHLRESGFDEIHFAADGAEALRALDGLAPDLVISDVHMPVLDGFQLVRLMRSGDFASLNRVPVVLMSATFRDHAAQRLAGEVGAQGFLPWPSSRADLAACVARSLNQPEPGVAAGAPVRILVAEDEPAIRTGLERVLTAAGFSVRAVGDGQSAIDEGDSFRPHLVLCDYMMPRVDGEGVLRWYREHRPDAPVIIVTAHGSERFAVEMMKAGAYDYIAKPFEMLQIPSLCRSALEKFSVKGISRQFGEMLDLLGRSEARYRALFEHAGEGIFLCDADGRVIEANEMAAVLCGSVAADLVGLALRDLVAPADVRQGADPIAALRRRGDLSLEAFLSLPGRRPNPVELSGAPVSVGGDGYWLAVVRDLADRKWIGAFVRHEHEFLKQLHRTTRIIDSEDGFSEFLSSTLRGVLSILEMDAGAIAAPSWGGEPFRGTMGNYALTVEGGLDAALADSAFERVLPRLRAEERGDGELPVLRDSSDVLTDLERGVGMRTRVCIELAFGDARYGALALWRRGAGVVSERDVTLLRSIATNLALALGNAALLARVSRAHDDWQRTLDAVGEAVLVVDAAGKVVRVNRAVCERKNASYHEIIGKDALSLLYGVGLRPEGALRLDPETVATARAVEHPMAGLGPGTFAARVSPLYGTRGELRGAAIVARDVTAERRAQQQLLIAEKMSTIGRMAAGVTHEINNPAAFVLLNVSHLQDRVAELQRLLEEYRASVLQHGGEEAVAALLVRTEELGLSDLVPEMAGIAAESLAGMHRIREITQELRLFSRVGEEEAREFDLNAIIDSALTIARHEVRHRARVERRQEPLPPCAGDPTRMTQVFVNLLVNAAQAIPEGHAEENVVHVRTRALGDCVVAEVADSGRGIRSEDLPRIFDPFFTTKEPGHGTGLGLALSYEIVKRHEGRIEVESELDRGSLFRVTLPVRVAIARAPATEERPAVAPSARILFIEDETALHRAVKRVLKEHDLHFAASGREAMALLERDRNFDLIFCDVVMPDVSGLEVFDLMKQKWPDLTERFAFMTGGVRSDEVMALIRAAARPVIEKPVEAARLRRLIAELRPAVARVKP